MGRVGGFNQSVCDPTCFLERVLNKTELHVECYERCAANHLAVEDDILYRCVASLEPWIHTWCVTNLGSGILAPLLPEQNIFCSFGIFENREKHLFRHRSVQILILASFLLCVVINIMLYLRLLVLSCLSGTVLILVRDWRLSARCTKNVPQQVGIYIGGMEQWAGLSQILSVESRNACSILQFGSFTPKPKLACPPAAPYSQFFQSFSVSFSVRPRSNVLLGAGLKQNWIACGMLWMLRSKSPRRGGRHSIPLCRLSRAVNTRILDPESLRHYCRNKIYSLEVRPFNHTCRYIIVLCPASFESAE